MEIRKGCQICNEKLAKYSCRRCSKLVCENDYDKTSGLCEICNSQRNIK